MQLAETWNPTMEAPIGAHMCERHRQLFIDTVKRAGLDPAKVDDIRRLVRAWVSARYPTTVLHHFHDGTCLGCEMEARADDASEVDRVLRAFEELLNAKANWTRY